jgi:hypothetical protein
MSRYCGPFVLAKLWGVTPDSAADLIREIDKDTRYAKGVRGMYHTSMEMILQKTVGVQAKVFEPRCRMKTWAGVRQKRNDKGTWVLLVTRHYVFYRDGMVFDTIAKDGIRFDLHPASKRRLRVAWYIGEMK